MRVNVFTIPKKCGILKAIYYGAQIMKKLLAFIALVMSSVLLVGCSCSGGAPALSLKSYWLDSDAFVDVQPIDETCTYTVTHKENDEDSRNAMLSVQYNEGATYVVNIKNVTKASDPVLGALSYVADGSYYRLTSTFENVGGTYHYDPSMGKDATKKQDAAFSGDYVRSVVYFKDTLNSLLPVYSVKQVRSTSPMISGGISASPAGYVFRTLAYEIVTEYTDVAKVTFTSKMDTVDVDSKQKAEIEDYLSSIAGAHTIKKYNKKSARFFDNEQILFAGRALTLDKGFSGTFRTIDLTSNLKSAVKVSMSTASKNAKVEIKGLDVDFKGTPRTSFNCIALNFGLASGGQTKTATYATDAADRHIMVRYSAPISDKLGTLVYTLKSVQ